MVTGNSNRFIYTFYFCKFLAVSNIVLILVFHLLFVVYTMINQN